jgi:hypothetical protein
MEAIKYPGAEAPHDIAERLKISFFQSSRQQKALA